MAKRIGSFVLVVIIYLFKKKASPLRVENTQQAWHSLNITKVLNWDYVEMLRERLNLVREYSKSYKDYNLKTQPI